MKKTILLLVATSGCSVISPGDSGVVFNRFTGSMRTEGQGAVGIIPFVTMVQSYPIALRTYTMVQKTGEGSDHDDDSIDLPSREGQHIRQDISITYNTSPDRAAEVFKSFKGAAIGDIEKSFIRRSAITVAQTVAGQMSLVELISTKRDEMQAAIQEKLSIELGKMGFVLDKVNLGAAHLPPTVEQQMQQKMAAQQEAQRAEYELLKQQTLAKAKVAEAEGQAKANAILLNAFPPSVLKNKALDKWDGVLPKYLGGSTPLPFLSLNEK